MIELKNVTKKFKNKVVLDHVSVKLKHGVYGLLGPNGAGKTTMIRCLLGLYKKNEGEILFDGKKKNKNIKIGYIPQSFELFHHMTVKECMYYFCSTKGIKKKEREAEVNRCLSLVNMEQSLQTFCGKLSGGMMRRVGIAQALLGRPDFVVLDEPTVGLDPEERVRFISLISKLREETIVLISTHIIEDVEECCENVIILNEGKVIFADSCAKLLKRAWGKVYEVEEKVIGDDIFLEKEVLHNGEKRYRVISKRKLGENDVAAKLEDAYMCVLKGIE